MGCVADIGVADIEEADIGVAGVSGVLSAPVCPPQVLHRADSIIPGIPAGPEFAFFPFRRGWYLYSGYLAMC